MKTKPKMMIEFKQAADPDVLELFIYDAIQGDYFDWWTGEEIESETSQDYFRKQLAEHPDVKEIRVYVNSGGGSVYEAMGIRAQLMRHPATVTAYVDGWAASAASLILTGCDRVVMDSASMQMLHNMWVLAAGNAKELRQLADELDKMMEGNRQAYLDKADGKLTESELIDLMDRETWLSAKQCVSLGLADEITKFTVQKKDESPEQRVKMMRQSLLEIVAQAEPPEQPEQLEPESQPEETPPDVDTPPNEAEPEPEPAEPVIEQEEAAERSGFSDFMAAFVRAAEGRVQ